jgi:hypothetical protein
VLKRIKQFFSGRSKSRPKMTWISAWAAASEEVGDNNDLGVTILLPTDVTYEMVVSYILDAARSAPVFETIVDRLTKQFGLRSRDAVTAIDRCLGGVFRAMESRPELCPDSTRDPIHHRWY